MGYETKKFNVEKFKKSVEWVKVKEKRDD